MGRATCLWIFPVKFGVFLLSFLITAVSAALVVATFLHKNPMMMHLAVIHNFLPWVYVILLIITAIVGIVGMITSLSVMINSHGFMAFFKWIFWLMTFSIVYIWQIILFILALVDQSKTREACNQANPHQDYNHNSPNANFTVDGYTTTLLGLNTGDTYGLANCDQAVQAGLIGLGILLFIGGLFTTWFGFIVNRCTRSLDTNSSRARNARWDDNLEELQSAYARDRKNAPQYEMQKKKSKFSRGFLKLKMNK